VPGITGIISNHLFLKNNPYLLDRMVAIQVNEKFYIKGRYDDNKIGIHVGWNNYDIFSCQKLPILNEKKDIAMIFIGEDYRSDRIDNSLQKSGHKFCGGGSDYIVHIYEEKGLDFLKDLNGLFCGLIIDFRTNEIHLFNDPFGMKRIYYHQSNEAFYFSSEAKCLLKVLPKLRSIDYDGLGEFFSIGCTLKDKTIFDGISIFPSGSIWSFSLGRVFRKKRYILFSKSNGGYLDKYSLYNKLKEIFPIIISRYYKNNERMGVSMTGGLDTRLIMSWANFPPYRVPCYTFSGIYRDCHDAKIARKVANACQQHHKIIRMTRAFFSEFPSLAKKTVIYTDGTMDVSGAPELYMLRQAREIAPIRLTGNYGDQVLRGVIGFKPKLLNMHIFDNNFALFIQKGIETYQELESSFYLDFFLYNQLPYHHYSRFALEQTQVLMRNPFLDKELINILYNLSKDAPLDLALTLKLIYEGNAQLTKIPTDRGKRYPSLPIITSLRSSIKEFTYKAEYAYDYGMPHWLSEIDSCLSKLNIQQLFLGRQKIYHFRTWYKNELSGYIKDILLSPRALNRPYIVKKQVENIIDLHTKGKRNYTREIHSLLTAELIHRHLIETL